MTPLPAQERPVIRDAVPADVGDLLRLIRALARYEREPDAVETLESDLHRALFDPEPKVFALVAETAGRVVGMAIYFVSFSTWTGRHGLYLEDLFVEPAHRSAGVGRALMSALADRSLRLGYKRLEWAVLDWNEPAISFYRSLGAAAMDEWTTYRLAGADLTGLAAGVTGEDSADSPSRPGTMSLDPRIGLSRRHDL
jgi:GNAT superfamily N-acetyltransferase